MGCISNPNWSSASSGGNQCVSEPPVKDPFFDAVHNVNLEQYPGFDLRHPRDNISHAVTYHSPGTGMSGKSEFSSYGEVHAARKNFIDNYRNDMANTKSTRFFENSVYNSKSYVFGFEKSKAGWHEITGYPKKR